MLGSVSQHCWAHHPLDGFWEGKSCRAAPEMVLDSPDVLFALEQGAQEKGAKSHRDLHRKGST